MPVPTPTFHNLNLNSSKNEVETRTQDLDSNDLAELKKWSDRHRADSGQTEHDSVRTKPHAVLLGPNNDELGLPSEHDTPSIGCQI